MSKTKYRLVVIIESYNIERINEIITIVNRFHLMSEIKEETLKVIEK